MERVTPTPRQRISPFPKARPTSQDCRWWASCFMDNRSCFSGRLFLISISVSLYWFFDRSWKAFLPSFFRLIIFGCHPFGIWNHWNITRTAPVRFYNRNVTFLSAITASLSSFQSWRICQGLEFLSCHEWQNTSNPRFNLNILVVTP